MRRLIVSEFVSIDGVVEAPGGEEGYAHTGWTRDHFAPAQGEYKLREVREAESLLLGRTTYEGFAAAWPQSDAGEFADKMNSMPKDVVSTTLHGALDWNATVLEGDPLEAVAALREGDGGPILVAGSRTLVQALLPAGLVDELRLMVFPVILGSGFRLYPESPDALALRLVDVTTFDSGVTNLTYHRA